MRNFSKLPVFVLSLVMVMTWGCNHARQFAERNVEKVKITLTAETWVIEEDLLNFTPVGTSADDVLTFVKKELHHSAQGKVKFDGLNVGPVITKEGMTEDVIFKSISVHMGIHSRTTKDIMAVGNWVFVTWLFNHKDELIDIIVVKYNPSEDFESDYYGYGDDEWDDVYDNADRNEEESEE